MVMYRIDDVQVRDAVTGQFRDELIGMPIKIVLRDTTTPAPIFDSVGDPIPDSKLYVTAVRTVPRFWVDVTDPSGLYLDWLDEGSGVRGNVDFDRVLRDATAEAVGVATAASSAAQGAQAAAEATTTEVATLRKWVELGVTQRNYIRDPRALAAGSTWGYSTGTGEVVSTTAVTGATDGPVLPDGTKAATYLRRTVTTPKSGGSSGPYLRTTVGDMPLVEGERFSAAFYLRCSLPVTVTVSVSNRSGGVNGSSSSVSVSVPANTWTRVGRDDVAEIAGDQAQVWAVIGAATVLPAGATVDVTGGSAHYGALPDYFDGSLRAGPNRGFRWSGAADASFSEMIDMSSISTDLKVAAEAAQAAAEAAANTNLPTGGNTGQVLAKRSGQDRDVEWITPSGGSGGGATTWDQIAGKPSTYPASTHQHTLSQLSDMSGLGRQVAAAGDAQTIRGLIGAGTGNGTSNLTLGSGATNAAPGNHGHAASSITFTPPSGMTATNVQDAIVQASQTGGGSGGGTNTVYIWKQSGGAYPALPSTKPAGVEEVAARGAQSPIQLGAVIPSWIGAGTGKASLEYLYNPTLT